MHLQHPMNSLPTFSDAEIVAARPPRNTVHAGRPYAWFAEAEPTPAGVIEQVGTIFLTNRECPFRCLMCDLWQNTTHDRVAISSISRQIDLALAELPPIQHIKLYNNGNFFDHQAIPTADRAAIADRVGAFRTVIVENHPALCSAECVRFRDQINTELEIAIGLETVHPTVLSRLNKRMTTDDFRHAVRFLRRYGIHVRAFVLLRPPFLSESEGIEWALRSVAFAFDAGVRICSVIPTRVGNGIMERLQVAGYFTPPVLASLEEVLEAGLAMNRGRVVADLWEAHQVPACHACRDARIARLRRMNLEQRVLPAIPCRECRSQSSRASTPSDRS